MRTERKCMEEDGHRAGTVARVAARLSGDKRDAAPIAHDLPAHTGVERPEDFETEGGSRPEAGVFGCRLVAAIKRRLSELTKAIFQITPNFTGIIGAKKGLARVVQNGTKKAKRRIFVIGCVPYVALLINRTEY